MEINLGENRRKRRDLRKLSAPSIEVSSVDSGSAQEETPSPRDGSYSFRGQNFLAVPPAEFNFKEKPRKSSRKRKSSCHSTDEAVTKAELESKRKRQERNRRSARESRRKKREYMTTLEAKVN
jgi:hypothetical protein